jgi:hypothetical protein
MATLFFSDLIAQPLRLIGPDDGLPSIVSADGVVLAIVKKNETTELVARNFLTSDQYSVKCESHPMFAVAVPDTCFAISPNGDIEAFDKRLKSVGKKHRLSIQGTLVNVRRLDDLARVAFIEVFFDSTEKKFKYLLKVIQLHHSESFIISERQIRGPGALSILKKKLIVSYGDGVEAFSVETITFMDKK